MSAELIDFRAMRAAADTRRRRAELSESLNALDTIRRRSLLGSTSAVFAPAAPAMPSMARQPLAELDGEPLTPLAMRVRDHLLDDGSFADLLRMVRDFELSREV
jgi:hypothetical protein